MQISYLCAKHNDWVYGHPQEALHFLARDEWQGTTLFCDGQFRECIAYLGCAFDIAVILLEVEEGLNQSMIEKVKSLSLLLCTAYESLRLTEYRRAIERRVQAVLQAVDGQGQPIALQRYGA